MPDTRNPIPLLQSNYPTEHYALKLYHLFESEPNKRVFTWAWNDSIFLESFLGKPVSLFTDHSQSWISIKDPSLEEVVSIQMSLCGFQEHLLLWH
ncbi:hypothetical protein AVEN_147131-1 [Araneus ventricosus]|uniref:Uncharacterized protein n=1 Tax=Araneus ventricosus TaxID=182803 RepID=A0A4Y2GCW9_ARAVE|nr:hypothetical protein AVEN_147131-1 [Araneus ventricosus]